MEWFVVKWGIRILQGLLVVGFLMSGILKLISSAEQIREMFTKPLGYGAGFMYGVGVTEIVAAIGLIVGFWRIKTAVLSSGYLILLMVGAMVSNLKEGLLLDATIPFLYLILAVIVFVGKRNKLKIEKIVYPSNLITTE
jgi:putative oxidoreductase